MVVGSISERQFFSYELSNSDLPASQRQEAEYATWNFLGTPALRTTGVYSRFELDCQLRLGGIP